LTFWFATLLINAPSVSLSLKKKRKEKKTNPAAILAFLLFFNGFMSVN
jgi:hypothetical protein